MPTADSTHWPMGRANDLTPRNGMFSPFVALIARKAIPTLLHPEQPLNGHRNARRNEFTPRYFGTNERGFERDRVDLSGSRSMRPNNNFRLCQFSLLFVLAAFLSCSLCLAQQADKENSPLPDAPKASIPKTKGFFARWAEFYRQDWSGTAASSPAPARRGLPSPLDSPPFPNSDWSYGGSPVIGEPDTNSYPLMTAINQASSRTKMYGWVDPTLNFSTSAHQQRARGERCLLESF